MSTSFTIGDYEINTVFDNPSLPRDPGTIFTDVPPEAWNPYRSIALTPEGKWHPDWRGHLIRSTSGEGPVILVDTGMGDLVNEITGESGHLLKNLTALGVQPEDVEVIVTTHCHGDHIGWNVTWDGDTPSLTFPNATHWIAERDWEHYSQAENKNSAFDKSVKPLMDLGALKLIHGVEQIAPGISTLPTNGHTPGHQCVLIESGGMTGVITGDLFHSVAQVTEQTWCPTFDWNTAMSTKSRKSLLMLASIQEWVVFTGHLVTGSSIGQVVNEGGKSTWKAL